AHLDFRDLRLDTTWPARWNHLRREYRRSDFCLHVVEYRLPVSPNGMALCHRLPLRLGAMEDTASGAPRPHAEAQSTRLRSLARRPAAGQAIRTPQRSFPAD